MAATAWVFLGACSNPVSPPDVLAEVLARYADRNFHPFAHNSVGGLRGELRGLTLADAERLLKACSNADDWLVVGDEPPRLVDGAYRNGKEVYERYSIMTCTRSDASIVARLNMSRELVDHRAELIYQSDFLACRTELCPDFAFGEPDPNVRFDPSPKFEVLNPVNSP